MIFAKRKIYKSSIYILINKNDLINQFMQQNITKTAQVGTAKQEKATKIIAKEGKQTN